MGVVVFSPPARELWNVTGVELGVVVVVMSWRHSSLALAVLRTLRVRRKDTFKD